MTTFDGPITKHFTKTIEWVDGRPRPAYREIISKRAVEELHTTAFSLPYERLPLEIELGIDEDLEGMTNGEVMVIRQARLAASGDSIAYNMLLDRILGKPKQSVEAKTLSLTYQDYLQELARDELNQPAPETKKGVDDL